MDSPFWKGISTLSFLAVIGLVFALILAQYLPPNSYNGAWHFFFQEHDSVLLLLFVILLFLFKKLDVSEDNRTLNDFSSHVDSKIVVTLISLMVLLITFSGSHVVYHNFALSMDEFLTVFQAKIFNQGALLLPIDEQWRIFARALQPLWVLFSPDTTSWVSSYYPVNALLHSIFLPFTQAHLASVLMAAASIYLLSSITVKCLGKQHNAVFIAVILLALSPQFLITAMTPYAMTAHLFFNLLWLFFFMRAGKIAVSFSLITGFLAIGLHQVHNFPAFVLPFIILLFIQRKRLLFVIHSLTYAAGLIFWIWWKGAYLPILETVPTVGSDASTFQHFINSIIKTTSRHDWTDLIAWPINFLRFISWQHLLLFPLLVSAYYYRKQMNPMTRAMVWSVILSLVPYIIAMPIQGHGWGYRYLHGLLGNITLLAVFGWIQLQENTSDRKDLTKISTIFVASSLTMLLLVLPIRSFQTEAIVGAFSNSMKHIYSQQEDVVLIDSQSIWYGIDLVRNEPNLSNKPKVMLINSLTENGLKLLCSKHSVRLVTLKDLTSYGMLPNAGIDINRLYQGYDQILQRNNCQPATAN